MSSENKEGCGQRVWLGWIRICRKLNDSIENLFEVHTRFITTHYRPVIVLCLLFTAIMGIGGIRFRALQRNEELFIPQGSEAFVDLDKGEKHFSLKFRVEEFIIAPKSGDIFDDNKSLLKTMELHEKIIALANFNKTCIKTSNSKCMFVSVLDLFNYNKADILAANTTALVKKRYNKWLNNANLLLRNGRPAALNFVNILGNYISNGKPAPDSTVISAKSIRMSYYMVYVDTGDTIYDTMTTLEDQYISICKNMVDQYAKDGYELFYFVGRTRDDAILESTIGDLPLFSVAFILMVLFCLFVFLRIKDPVIGHLTVGIAGIFVIMLGVGCGFGLAMWTGNDFVAFTGILMFLILGIGMDNMFIIVDALESVDPNIQGPERLVMAMRHIGGSITMTTSTDLVAFAVSTVTDFPAVRLFCIYASLSIFFAYMMLITLFLALMTADINRIEAGKRDVCPCCTAVGYRNDNPWLRSEENVSRKILRKWGEFLMKTPVKVVVFITACGLLAIGIYGTTTITQKFEWKKLGRDGSYFRKFANARDGYFPAGYGVSIILPTGLNYTANNTQNEISALDTIAKDNKRYEETTLNWMTKYRIWANRKNMTGDFYKNLDQFLAENTMFKADVNMDANKTMIKSSRVVFFYENSLDSINQAEAMKTMRADLKRKSSLTGIYPITILFIYAEQFAAALDDTIRNLAICAGAIVLITLPYLMHPGITGLVCLSFSSLIFELLGLMAAWDVSLDVIAMVIIIMAIGFSVDYTCHIAHSYMISRKNSPEKRAIEALETIGTSVLNGGISTILGMVITAASNSEGFRIFFKMVFGIVLLGLIHGLVFLPVLLTMFVRRDLRSDMKEFVKNHDDEVRKRSQRRFSRMSEQERCQQSLGYRRKSVIQRSKDIEEYTISEENEVNTNLGDINADENGQVQVPTSNEHAHKQDSNKPEDDNLFIQDPSAAENGVVLISMKPTCSDGSVNPSYEQEYKVYYENNK